MLFDNPPLRTEAPLVMLQGFDSFVVYVSGAFPIFACRAFEKGEDSRF
jgi:hypothetical protein